MEECWWSKLAGHLLLDVINTCDVTPQAYYTSHIRISYHRTYLP